MLYLLGLIFSLQQEILWLIAFHNIVVYLVYLLAELHCQLEVVLVIELIFLLYLILCFSGFHEWQGCFPKYYGDTSTWS